MKAFITSPTLAVLSAALPTTLFAHAGHGLGTLGHGFDHALWNFAGLVVVSAAALLAQRYGSRKK